MILHVNPDTRVLHVDGTIEQRAACEVAFERLRCEAVSEQRLVPIAEDTLRAVRAGAVEVLGRWLDDARDGFERGRLQAALDDARGGRPDEVDRPVGRVSLEQLADQLQAFPVELSGVDEDGRGVLVTIGPQGELPVRVRLTDPDARKWPRTPVELREWADRVVVRVDELRAAEEHSTDAVLPALRRLRAAACGERRPTDPGSLRTERTAAPEAAAVPTTTRTIACRRGQRMLVEELPEAFLMRFHDEPDNSYQVGKNSPGTPSRFIRGLCVEMLRDAPRVTQSDMVEVREASLVQPGDGWLWIGNPAMLGQAVRVVALGVDWSLSPERVAELVGRCPRCGGGTSTEGPCGC